LYEECFIDGENFELFEDFLGSVAETCNVLRLEATSLEETQWD